MRTRTEVPLESEETPRSLKRNDLEPGETPRSFSGHPLELGKTLYFFSPAGGRFGTSLGSYLAPAETWMRVMRTLVEKNFSGSGRVWALAPVPSLMTRSICLMPSLQTMSSFCHRKGSGEYFRTHDGYN